MAGPPTGRRRFYNLGIGRGYSVREVIDAAKRVTGHGRSRWNTARGGPATRRSSSPTPKRSSRELGWSARHTDIDAIVATAWKWFQHHPTGYGD